MTVFANSWFFRSPGRDSHNIAERVRQSLWASGLYSIWLDTCTTTAPFLMAGNHGEEQLELEWEPGTWLRLRTQSKSELIRDHLQWVIGSNPSMQYTDQYGWTVWEWLPRGSAARWREISGNPIYQNPRRFS